MQLTLEVPDDLYALMEGANEAVVGWRRMQPEGGVVDPVPGAPAALTSVSAGMGLTIRVQPWRAQVSLTDCDTWMCD